MKIVIPALLFAVTLVSCKKDTQVTENTEDFTVDSVIVPESNEVVSTVIPFRKIEFSPEQAAEFLKPKENDTLYVTNFFATWCGPCIRELPHFTEKMARTKYQPVKFTFVSVDDRAEWDVTVKEFTEEHGISGNTVLLDGAALSPEFFANNFKQWDGGSIPFTVMKRGNVSDETIGAMSKAMLEAKMNALLPPAVDSANVN